jgi:hypothetical protein
MFFLKWKRSPTGTAARSRVTGEMDPGWKPALNGIWRGVMPQLTTRSKKPTLIVLRSIWLYAPVSWLLFFSVLSFLEQPESSARPGWVLPAIVVAGVMDVYLVLYFRRRQLDLTSSEALARSYSQISLIAWSMANSSVLFGFVGFFLGHGMPAYFLGLPFAAVGLALMMPTSRNISMFQEQIRAKGSSLSLLEALARPYERPSARKKI